MINVFGLYWGLFFFTAFGELVLAGVFAEVNILPMDAYAHYIQDLTMFFVVVLVQRQVLYAQLRPGLRLMECYGTFPFLPCYTLPLNAL